LTNTQKAVKFVISSTSRTKELLDIANFQISERYA